MSSIQPLLSRSLCIHITANIRSCIFVCLRTGTKPSEISRTSFVIGVTIKKNVLKKIAWRTKFWDYWQIYFKFGVTYLVFLSSNHASGVIIMHLTLLLCKYKDCCFNLELIWRSKADINECCKLVAWMDICSARQKTLGGVSPYSATW